MKVLLDENGYVTSYMTVGDLDGGVEVSEPQDLAHFESNFYGYQYDGTCLQYHEERANEISNMPAVPTQLDAIEAQVTYTAMMTDTLLEV